MDTSLRFANGIIDAVSVHICVLDGLGTIIAVNQAWREFCTRNGGRDGAYLGVNYFELCEKAGATAMAEGIRAVLSGKSRDFVLEYDCHSPDRQRWFIGRVTRFHDEVAFVVLTHEDISEQKQSEARLQLAANVFAHAGEGIMITDAEGAILDVNDAFIRLTGYSREEVRGRNPRMLQSGRQSKEFYAVMWNAIREKGNWSGEIWNRRKSGEVYAEMLGISAIRDEQGQVVNYVALFSDITSLKQHEQQLEEIAHYDVLTKLPNRVLLSDRIKQALAQSLRRGNTLAVVYLDLDGFKEINDRWGHNAGDELLIAIAQRMKQALRDGDTLARIGGDEFVVLLVDLERRSVADAVLSRLLDAAAEPVTLGDMVLQVSASAGVTYFPQDQTDADHLLRHADQAMYVAKQSGKNRYHVFDIDGDSAVRTQLESIKRIETALKQGEFVLFFQPKVNMRSGAVIGAEALIRWNHPERGLLPPGSFLPQIEDHPVAIELGFWVIGTALDQLAAWRAQGLDLRVSVNVGALQLLQSDFLERLRSLLAAHPTVSPADLEIEILETSALEDIIGVTALMRQVRALGVRFSLDDFGTGYSSLTYLRRLPADTIKIDQTFVREILDNPEDLAIVRGVIGLANAFGREVIAEGVETDAHCKALLAMECELAQGYAIARPIPADDIGPWIARWNSRPAAPRRGAP